MTRPPPRTRNASGANWIDALILFAAVALAVYVVYRVNSVLAYHWDWPRVFNFVLRYDAADHRWVPNLLLQGAATTLRLAFWGTILASLIGIAMGLCRTSHNLTLRILARGYVELVRNLPPLVFIFIFYFFISSQLLPLVGLDDIRPDGGLVSNAGFQVLFGPPALLVNFMSGLVCLALFEGAYVTEIVRAGLQSIETGQWEAARAIGLSRRDVLRDIVLPQAIRRILPPLAGQFIALVKDSAIVSLISIQELTFLASEVASTTQRVFETWLTVGAMYFVICYSLSRLFSLLERGTRARDG